MKRSLLVLICFSALSLQAGPTVLRNDLLQVSMDPATARFSVKDLRTGQTWDQPSQSYVQLSDVRVSDNRLHAALSGPNGISLQVEMELPEQSAELKVTLSGSSDTPVDRFLSYPYPFLPHKNDLFILPEHEGVGIPVNDYAIMDNKYASEHVAAPVYNKRYRFYSGHDISMTFWGYAGEQGSCMTIVETPNDAGLRVQSFDGLLSGGVEWDSSRGTFGYSRTLRYVFFDQGGYNAICKRYREYAFKTGLLKKLTEKSPDSIRFVRDALVWSFSPGADQIALEMKKAGMEHLAVTGPFFTPGEVQRLNEAGVLNGVYDNLRSVLPPEYMDKVKRVDPTDIRAAYPDEIVMMENGKPFDYGWPKGGIDGKTYRTLDVCDLKQADYARRRIEQNMAHRPMTIRFYDTLAAFPWTECYDPNHPTTRSQVREARMSVLKLAAEDYGMVMGAEAGHIFAVPYATYFEGMNHSRFFYYQIKGHPLFVWGRETEIPEEYRKAMQIEHKYRLPLWELVAHDCCVAHTRWNTPNNKIHSDEWWDHMDLWNILYGTPPMYMFINDPMMFWETYKECYLQSYRNVVEGVLAKTAGQEMTEHRFLTADKDVQQTCFANGVKITVNFGSKPFTMDCGESLAAGKYRVDAR